MEKKYQLNIWIDKPSCYEKDIDVIHCDKYFHIDNLGMIHECGYWNDIIDAILYKSSVLFKDKESAETYKELMSDVRRLHKAFRYNEFNYFLYYECDDEMVYVDFVRGSQSRGYYFTQKDAYYILDKYGQEVIKNWILYCK